MSYPIYLLALLGCLGSWLMAPIYLAWVVVRSMRRHRIKEGTDDHASVEARRRLSGDGDVKFEALCGMVLAFPAIVFALAVIVGGQPAIGWPLFVAVLALYAVPILAIKGSPLPVWARWWPAIFAIAVTSLGTVAAWVGGGPWESAVLIFGCGFVASIVVGVRLARAVRRRDDGAQALVSSESSFVWPY